MMAHKAGVGREAEGGGVRVVGFLFVSAPIQPIPVIISTTSVRKRRHGVKESTYVRENDVIRLKWRKVITKPMGSPKPCDTRARTMC